ncbi:phosphatase PAP2 family protein, partial [Legionella tunisiensis]|uniref:phosphatase PAP2 family protein n=1 Tax=Legionella tunisiensis TaxID=1034944 RepID=UPI0012EA62AE
IFCLILAESIARIILKVHWLTDVIGGFFLGSACALIGAYSYHLKPDPSFDLPAFLKHLSLFSLLLALFII